MMASSLSKSLKLRHRLNMSSQLYPRIAAFSTSDASLASSSSSQAQSTPSPSASQSQEKKRGPVYKLLIFLPGAICFGLATSHLFRAKEKVKKLAYRIQRVEMEPLTSAELPLSSNNMDSLEFRRVVCHGDFDEKKSVFATAWILSKSISGKKENGYYVITPLISREIAPGARGVQTPVLVNRGWVPREWRDKRMSGKDDLDKDSNSSVSGNNKGEKSASWWNFWLKKRTSYKAKEAVGPTSVKVVGVIRGSEKRSIFGPPNDPDSGQWFYVDVPMIARACGLPENSIYIEQIEDEQTASANNHYPVPKDMYTLVRFLVMPQDHLDYAAERYAHAVVITVMAAMTKKFHL